MPFLRVRLYHVVVHIMKVLIAERDCKVIDDITIAFSLVLPDWELITTDSGKECLDKAKGNSLDLVILGLDLADMSGFDVLDEIRSFSGAAVIALYSKNDSMSIVRALNSGADQCIAKPLRQLEFIARVRAVLRGRLKENAMLDVRGKRS